MIGIPTWTQAKAMMGVLVNGTFLPFEAAPKTMQRFVRPALFSTGDEIFELRKFGTAFMARYRGWSFGMTTAHQTSGDEAPEASKFVVVIDHEGKRLAVPPSAIHYPKFPEGLETLSDLTFFDYDKADPAKRPQHLNLADVAWSDNNEMKTEYSFLVGYPTGSVRIEFDPGDEVKLSEFVLGWVRQDLEPAERQLMDTDNRIMFVKHHRSTNLSIDPDGLSGSPVFSLVVDNDNERHLRFDGIITNANGDRFAVYPSAQIRQVLDSIVDGTA